MKKLLAALKSVAVIIIIVAVFLGALVGFLSFGKYVCDTNTSEKQATTTWAEDGCRKIAEETGVPNRFVKVSIIAQLPQYWCVESSGKMHQLHNGYLSHCQPSDPSCSSNRKAVEEACARAGFGQPIDGNTGVVTCEDGKGVGYVLNPLNKWNGPKPTCN